jgi:hypothetical protein
VVVAVAHFKQLDERDDGGGRPQVLFDAGRMETVRIAGTVVVWIHAAMLLILPTIIRV